MTFQTGDRVSTPSGRVGIIITPAGNPTLPHHCLIEFEQTASRPGDRQWTLAEILTLAPELPPTSEGKRSRRRKTPLEPA